MQSLLEECNAQVDGIVSADYLAEVESLLQFLHRAEIDDNCEEELGKNIKVDKEEYNKYIMDCISNLRQTNFSSNHNDSSGSIDFADNVSNALCKASEVLEGLSVGNAVAASITNLVLSLYINVINETATAMTRSGLQSEANEWYMRGVRVADVIASNDTATQFFSLLKQNHLKSIIGSINECLVNRLTISQRI